MPIKNLSAGPVINGLLLELGGSCVFLGICSPSKMEGAGKCQCAGWSPFLRLSLALRPQRRGHRESGKQRGKPPSQFWAFLPRVPASPLPALQSSLQQLRGQSEGGHPGPCDVPSSRLVEGHPAKIRQRAKPEGGSADEARSWSRIRLAASFLPPLLPALLGLRHGAQDLIRVSLFKCPNPCKGLVSGRVHFAQY